jgi:hypothetical protein
MRFIRWIHGTGHPRAMKNEQITPQRYNQDRLDRGLRARLFHMTTTGSQLRLITGTAFDGIDVWNTNFLYVSVINHTTDQFVIPT